MRHKCGFDVVKRRAVDTAAFFSDAYPPRLVIVLVPVPAEIPTAGEWNMAARISTEGGWKRLV